MKKPRFSLKFLLALMAHVAIFCTGIIIIRKIELRGAEFAATYAEQRGVYLRYAEQEGFSKWWRQALSLPVDCPSRLQLNDRKLTPSDADFVRRFPTCQYLEVDCTQETTKFLQGISGFSQILSLSIMEMELGQADMLACSQLPNLKRLEIKCGYIADERTFEPLVNCKRLERLEIAGCDMEYSLDFLSRMQCKPTLTSLDLQGGMVDVFALETLADFPRLVDVSLSSCQLKDLAGCPSPIALQDLNLHYVYVDSSFYGWLNGCRDLQRLGIYESHFSSEELFDSLPKMPHLCGLSLCDCECDAKSLLRIGELTNLWKLSIKKTDGEITVELAEQIAKLPKLESLDLSENHLQAGVLAEIAKLPALRELRLNDCELDAADLEPLKGMAQLIVLDVNRNLLTDKQQQEFEKALPNCSIQWSNDYT